MKPSELQSKMAIPDELLSFLKTSRQFSTFQEHFRIAANQELSLLSSSEWPPCKAGKCLNVLCSSLLQKGGKCLSCLNVPKGISSQHPIAVTCLGGIQQTAVPVLYRKEVIGYLSLGPSLTQVPSARELKRAINAFATVGSRIPARVERNYFAMSFMGESLYSSLVNVMTVLSDLLSSAATEWISSAMIYPSGILRVVEHIKVHYSEGLSLDEAARMAGFSREHFCRSFKKANGVTFSRYLSAIRVDHAKTKLAISSLRVSEIADVVGFKSLTHFNRSFKSLAGTNPSVYRERITKTPEDPSGKHLSTYGHKKSRRT